MSISQSCLLIIDMQRGFLKKIDPSFIEKVNMLKKLPFKSCILTQFQNRNNSPFIRFMNWTGLMDSFEQEIMCSITDTDYVVRKRGYSSYNRRLISILKDNDITTVYLCGVDTDACVLATAYSLFDAGYRPVIVKDCCASSGGEKLHDAAMIIINRSFGLSSIVDYSDIASKLTAPTGKSVGF